MSRKPTKIHPIRAERLKELIEDLKMSQTDFSESVNYSQQHISGIVQKKTALTEETAESIIEKHPKYNLQWLLGHSDIKYKKDFEKCFIKDKDIRNAAYLTVLDTALHEVCVRDDISVPSLDNIPELLLLESQLKDYAFSLMDGYIHRDRSHVWTYIDSLDK